MESRPDHWLFGEYRPPTGLYDEACAGPGELREHFRDVIEAFETLKPEGLKARSQEAQRLLRESGVTYSIYDDPQGPHRPWTLDLLPMVLTHAQWKTIETGLSQRAELLNRILIDLYGPQQLIKEKLLPAEFVFAHPGFILPCFPMNFPQNRPLVLYAADLARDRQGEPIVLSDRAQAPSGAGYALENRLVMSRVMPNLYREAQVQRMAMFFRAYRDTLASLAVHSKGEPRVVLHTPGPDNETYFEHAYLASYMGYTLVEGSDMTVRDSRVWLKTLEGLQPIDVILRRVDDSYCDPLELRSESLLGTPGLVQAVRRGRVAVANPLGSGLLENPALPVFLPQLCQALLGEELKMQSVPSWWCGRPDDCRYVLEHLEELFIRSIKPQAEKRLIRGDHLSAAEKASLIERIQQKPHLYVAQTPIELSTAPVLVGDRVEARRMSLRCFLVARQHGYFALPGGLTRVAGQADQRIVTNQTGGLSKDTWVIQAAEPEAPWVLPLTPARKQLLTRGGDDLPSRVAENLFWLGRYTERTESLARLLREAMWRLLDRESDFFPDRGLSHLLQTVTHYSTTYPGFVGSDAASKLAEPRNELMALLCDPGRIGGMRFNVHAVLRAARSVRDRLSDDTWRLMNSLEQMIATPGTLSDLLENAERLILLLAGFSGLSNESMSRGPSWRFIEIGRRLERALGMLTLLRLSFPAKLPEGAQPIRILLGVSDSWKTYRLRYGSTLQSDGVLDLTLVDESHPRSVGHQFVRLHELVSALPVKVQLPRRSTEERCLLEAQAALRLADVLALAPPAADQPPAPELDQLLSKLRGLLIALADGLSQSHFSHTLELPQQLVDYR